MAPSTMDMRRLRGEYKTASNTDITIVACDKHEFEAHAEVLDEKCPKLKKNAAKFDVESGRITLSDTFCEYARVIEKFLDWVYEIPYKPSANQTTREEMGDLMQLTTFAYKYGLSRNKEQLDFEEVLLPYAHQQMDAIINPAKTHAQALDGIRELSIGTNREYAIHQYCNNAHKVYTNKPRRASKKDSPVEEAVADDAEATPASSKKRKKTEKAPDHGLKEGEYLLPTEPPEDDPDGKWCVCGTKDRESFLVLCSTCYKWFHPDCIGKGGYTADTYRSKREWARGKDWENFKHAFFVCGKC